MQTKDIRLLYIEDELGLIEVMQALLEERVKELYIAKDGEEALEVYEEQKPDVMLVDINIPKINGLEVVEQIRQKDQNVKVILLTAHSDSEILQKAAELKITKYLIKPIISGELQEALDLAAKEIV